MDPEQARTIATICAVIATVALGVIAGSMVKIASALNQKWSSEGTSTPNPEIPKSH